MREEHSGRSSVAILEVTDWELACCHVEMVGKGLV